MELNDIKRIAKEMSHTIEIQWDMLEQDPQYVADFEQTLRRAALFLPDLETLYQTIQSGKSVLSPDEDTPLTFEQKEAYLHLLEEELLAGYELREVWERYQLIKSITEMTKNDV
jgi:hypothetical protein